MGSLVDISNEIRDVLYKLDSIVQNGEDPPAELMDLSSNLLTKQGEKVDRCASYVTHEKKEIEWIKDEIKQLQVEQKKKQRSVDRMLHIAKTIMVGTGLKKLEGLRGKFFSQRKSKKVVIEDLEKIPGKYIVISKTPLKTDIKKDLLAGKDVPGARLEDEINITVR